MDEHQFTKRKSPQIPIIQLILFSIVIFIYLSLYQQLSFINRVKNSQINELDSIQKNAIIQLQKESEYFDNRFNIFINSIGLDSNQLIEKETVNKINALFTYTTVSKKTSTLIRIKFSPEIESAETYEWTFGDGQASTIRAPEHDFNISERTDFIVKLKISKNNESDEKSKTLNFKKVPEPKNIVFKLSKNIYCSKDDNCYEFESIPKEGIVSSSDVQVNFKNGKYCFTPQDIKTKKNYVSFIFKLKDTSVSISVKIIHTSFQIQSSTDSNNVIFKMIPEVKSDNYYWEFTDGQNSREWTPSRKFNLNEFRKYFLDKPIKVRLTIIKDGLTCSSEYKILKINK